MKILTKEEEDAHYQATLKGGVKGGLYGLGLALPASYLLNHPRYGSTFYRGLTLPLKAFLVSSTATFTLIVAADRASRNFEQTRHQFAFGRQKDAAQLLEEERLSRMTTSEKFMNWGRENRYKIVGGSWVASMAGSLALVYRDKYLTKAQKLVQARVYAQGLTLLVLIASAAFEIHDARSGRVQEHVEHYKGEDLWKDMVKKEEERLATRAESVRRAGEAKTEKA